MTFQIASSKVRERTAVDLLLLRVVHKLANRIRSFGLLKSSGCDWSKIPNVQDVIGCHLACSSVFDQRNTGTELSL